MFTVFKCFGRSEAREKDFTRIEDATNYILAKLQDDITFKINANYRIYEGADMVKELTQQDAPKTSTSSSDSSSDSSSGSGSASKGSKQVFSPTPLSTTLRPPGVPQNWKDVPDDDKKK
jgi:hypothetical protein